MTKFFANYNSQLFFSLDNRTLHRMLDVILQEEEQSIQLKLPDPSLYM